MFQLNMIREKAEWVIGKSRLNASAKAAWSGRCSLWEAIPLWEGVADTLLHAAGATAHLFTSRGSSWSTGDFLFFYPQNQAMKGLPLFRCWLFPHAIGGKSALGLHSFHHLATGKGFYEKKGLQPNAGLHTVNPYRWISQVLPALEPVLKEEHSGVGFGQGLPPQTQCTSLGYPEALGSWRERCLFRNISFTSLNFYCDIIYIL